MRTLTREIHCCACEAKVQARLTDGAEIYPHRPDLAHLPFWKCDTCGNAVGCHHRHHDESKRLDPLGIIPTPALKNARNHLHRRIDPIWKSGRISRSKLYRMLTKRLGWRYHTACIRSVDEAREVWRHVREIEREIAG